MAEKLDSKETVDIRELLMANTFQVDPMYLLLTEKGYLTEAAFFSKMKEVQKDYNRGGGN
jgi:hypothetical protein